MVIGAGQMGSGIAQVMASHGVEVVLRDIKQEFVDRGISNIEKNLAHSVAKGRITEDDKKATLAKIHGVVEMTQETCNVHLAIEAATENLKIKQDIFKTLDELCPADYHCQQHFFRVHHPAGCRHQETGQIHRHAFL